MAISFSRLRAITKQMTRRAERTTAMEARRNGTPVQTQQVVESKYMVGGTKKKNGQTHTVEIAVYEKNGTKGDLVSIKKSEGTDLQTVFESVINSINIELSQKNITDVTLPTVDELRG